MAMGTVGQNIFGDLIAHLHEVQNRTNGMILMVGEPQRMQTLKRHFSESASVFFIEYADLTSEILRSLRPESVVAPAISEHFDCFDLAAFLTQVSYQGEYRVMTKGLPRPDIIRRELRKHYPALNFDMLTSEPVQDQQAVH